MTRASASASEELHQLFAAYLNQEDLAGLISLYEPSAHNRRPNGAALDGVAAIRLSLAELLATRPTVELRTRRAAVCGELALLSNNWRATVAGAEGDWAEATTAEITRRQADGRSLYVIDDPAFCQ